MVSSHHYTGPSHMARPCSGSERRGPASLGLPASLRPATAASSPSAVPPFALFSPPPPGIPNPPAVSPPLSAAPPVAPSSTATPRLPASLAPTLFTATPPTAAPSALAVEATSPASPPSLPARPPPTLPPSLSQSSQPPQPPESPSTPPPPQPPPPPAPAPGSAGGLSSRYAELKEMLAQIDRQSALSAAATATPEFSTPSVGAGADHPPLPAVSGVTPTPPLSLFALPASALAGVPMSPAPASAAGSLFGGLPTPLATLPLGTPITTSSLSLIGAAGAVPLSPDGYLLGGVTATPLLGTAAGTVAGIGGAGRSSAVPALHVKDYLPRADGRLIPVIEVADPPPSALRVRTPSFIVRFVCLY